MNVPDDAVHAARVAYRREFPYDENEDYVLTTILEAAAPLIAAQATPLYAYTRIDMAQAWDEGWREGWPMKDNDPAFKRNPYKSEQL